MPHIFIDNMNLECALRLLIAVVCGGLIGIERTHRSKGAGIRTHILVAMGAALFVIVSKYGFVDAVFADNTSVDVSRVASSIVAGVSFLGAGIIFMKGDSVQGLTTAAGIWVTAAIGLSLGAGLYILGVAGTVLIILVQYIMHRGLIVGMDGAISSKIVVSMKDDSKAFAELQEQLKEKRIEIYGSHIKRHKDDTLTYYLDVRIPQNLTARDLHALLEESASIKSIGM